MARKRPLPVHINSMHAWWHLFPKADGSPSEGEPISISAMIREWDQRPDEEERLAAETAKVNDEVSEEQAQKQPFSPAEAEAVALPQQDAKSAMADGQDEDHAVGE